MVNYKNEVFNSKNSLADCFTLSLPFSLKKISNYAFSSKYDFNFHFICLFLCFIHGNNKSSFQLNNPSFFYQCFSNCTILRIQEKQLSWFKFFTLNISSLLFYQFTLISWINSSFLVNSFALFYWITYQYILLGFKLMPIHFFFFFELQTHI